MMKNKIFLCLILCLAFVLCACGDSSDASDGEFTLYYTNDKQTMLTSYTYKSDESDSLALIKELFEDMEGVSISGSVSVIPADVKYKDVVIEGETATLYLSGNMDNDTTQEKNLFYAAMSRAVTQVDGISGIIIKINDENVTDGAGNSLGIIRPSMFISNAADDFEDYIEASVTLYYANATLDHLVKTKSTVYYRSTTPIERVIVEQIIAGPENSIYSATVPGSLSILSIDVKDRVCYINLDSQFVNETVSSYDEIPVYSIVNSLTSLDDIDAVQFSINGDSSVTMPQGQISFDSPLKFNENILE